MHRSRVPVFAWHQLATCGLDQPGYPSYGIHRHCVKSGVLTRARHFLDNCTVILIQLLLLLLLFWIMTATGGQKELVEYSLRMRGSGSVRATKVVWEGASGTWREGSGWTCDACHVMFHDDGPGSRQKRKLETHVTDTKHQCTHQARARATRASQAAMGAPQALKPSLLPVSRAIASLQSRDGWTLTKPPAV